MIPPAMTEWGDILTNKILTTVSVILFLLYLGDLFKLMPSMMYSIGRPRRWPLSNTMSAWLASATA